MQIQTEITSQDIRLKLSGSFDMSSNPLFRKIYSKLLAEATQQEVVVDLAAIEYLDSSALGMLLLLRQDAEARQITVRISGCSSFVGNVLRTAHFDRLFAITS